MPLSKLVLATLIALSFHLVQPASANQITPAQAGEIVQRQTGGRVLAVKPADGGYQVKVLTPDGSVRYVFVPSR